MAIIHLPLTLLLGPDCGIGQRTFDLAATSETTGSEQVRLLAPPKWTLRLVQPARLTLAEAGAWTAMLVQLRGRGHVLRAWDPVRAAPQGTLRGAPTLAATAAAGAEFLSLTAGATQAGRTLQAGDWLQVADGLGASQLVMCVAAATTDGNGSAVVSTAPPLRRDHAAGTAITLVRAAAYFRLQSAATAWTYGHRGTTVTGIALDLLETWS